MKKKGLLLTGKQKVEAQRLAAVREQLLAQAGLDPSGEPHMSPLWGVLNHHILRGLCLPQVGMALATTTKIWPRQAWTLLVRTLAIPTIPCKADTPHRQAWVSHP